MEPMAEAVEMEPTEIHYEGGFAASILFAVVIQRGAWEAAMGKSWGSGRRRCRKNVKHRFRSSFHDRKKQQPGKLSRDAILSVLFIISFYLLSGDIFNSY